MTEHGKVAKGETQIGKVRRPLAAVSNLTKRGNQIAFFCENEDWLIDKKDEVAAEILELVRKAKKKTKKSNKNPKAKNSRPKSSSIEAYRHI